MDQAQALLNMVTLHFDFESRLNATTFRNMQRIAKERADEAYASLSVEDKVAHQGRVSLCGSD